MHILSPTLPTYPFDGTDISIEVLKDNVDMNLMDSSDDPFSDDEVDATI